MNKTGWRKPTPELCVSEQYAQIGEQMSVPKIQALIAVKRVSAKIGLRGADMVLLDLLCALSQPQDWEEGARPIVWPSNQFLTEQLGLSLRAVQRHTRKLGDLGLIAFKDNSNGHRRGKRDEKGRIVEAYGFDLSPLQARAGEFERIYTEITAERQFIKTMRKRITVARRSIRGMMQTAIDTGLNESYSGEWSYWNARLDCLIERIPAQSATSDVIAQIAYAFVSLHEEAKTAYEKALNIEGMAKSEIDTQNQQVVIVQHERTKYHSDKVITEQERPNKSAKFCQNLASINAQNDSPILITNYNKIKNCNSEKSPAPIMPRESALEKTNRQIGDDMQHNEPMDSFANLDIETIKPTTVVQSCPQFSNYARAMGTLNNYKNKLNWASLINAASKVSPSMGISDKEWNDSSKLMGKNSTAIAIALIFEKYQAQEILSPGGYLKALTARALRGELHLTKSIYGRLNLQRTGEI